MERQLQQGSQFKSLFGNIIVSREQWLTIVSLIFLLGGFLGIINWFAIKDVYHHHFFQSGSLVLIYNLFRTAFAFFLFWLIYAAGYFVLFLFFSGNIRHQFTFIERLIVGFGIGIGFWHVLLLILGVCNLYYRSVMIWLCIAVLIISAKHFKQIVSEAVQVAMTQLFEWRQGIPLQGLITLIISIGLFWLLMVRGLYPGGGGDYFTHYFYYYIEVLHHHGLVPNDVWYHYYYSKGAGLYFLGMLLTDPEAPEIVTFCCVAVATLALTSLSSRIAPRSLWPVCCALLYIFYNLVSLDEGGEFQKTHEETSALMAMLTWAICMYEMRPKEWEKPLIMMMAAVVIGAAIVTQATAVFFAVLFGCFACMSLWKKNIRQMCCYSLLVLIASVAIIGIFTLNYLVTGLATDQAIYWTWHFANVERLNQWGVIPNVFIVSWIRDNYQVLVLPWGWNSLAELAKFMRLNQLWVAVSGSLMALCFCLSLFRRLQNKATLDESSRMIMRILVNVSITIFIFAILSLFAGRSQSVSFFRFSSFFVPLLILFCVGCWGLFIHVKKPSFPLSWILRMEIPIILLFFTLLSWPHWFNRVQHITKYTTRFMKGKYSLARAYTHQYQGLPFGGINPAAYEAVRHVPLGARVWSTNVDSYCMVPNCKIESVVSFKLSSHLNEILSSSPAVAKKWLQSEGLNYFIFSTKSRLIDLLPYSQLFNPETISKYFAIKWTDGNTYLLTWKGPNTVPLDSKFLHEYIVRVNEPESSWFRFGEAVPKMNEVMTVFAKLSHPWYPIKFPSSIINDS